MHPGLAFALTSGTSLAPLATSSSSAAALGTFADLNFILCFVSRLRTDVSSKSATRPRGELSATAKSVRALTSRCLATMASVVGETHAKTDQSKRARRTAVRTIEKPRVGTGRHALRSAEPRNPHTWCAWHEGGGGRRHRVASVARRTFFSVKSTCWFTTGSCFMSSSLSGQLIGFLLVV